MILTYKCILRYISQTEIPFSEFKLSRINKNVSSSYRNKKKSIDVCMCLFAGNSRSVCGHVCGHHYGAGLPRPLRAWYLGHAGGHRVA